VERLKLPKPEETKLFVVVNLWEIRIDGSSNSGVSTQGERKCGEVDTHKAQRAEVDMRCPSQRDMCHHILHFGGK
jgi:hypothetical protein